VSALAFGGKPLEVVELALKKEFLLIISSHIVGEVRKNLTKKLGLKTGDVEHYLQTISEVATFFTPTGSVNILKDTKDDLVLETALMGFGEVLVTGDKAIVDLKSVGDLKIETTSLFLRRFSKGNKI
jgi:putative PIN family toxin of toxin-antitoxin system